jgi:hypothetical protein
MWTPECVPAVQPRPLTTWSGCAARIDLGKHAIVTAGLRVRLSTHPQVVAITCHGGDLSRHRVSTQFASRAFTGLSGLPSCHAGPLVCAMVPLCYGRWVNLRYLPAGGRYTTRQKGLGSYSLMAQTEEAGARVRRAE